MIFWPGNSSRNWLRVSWKFSSHFVETKHFAMAWRCRCARCRQEDIERGLVCPIVLRVRSLRGVDNAHDGDVAKTIQDVDVRSVVLRSGWKAGPGAIQYHLSDCGVVSGPSLAFSLCSLSRWHWFVLNILRIEISVSISVFLH